MANIQNELNNIKNAVFGKDVRDSIHDAIKTCYDDASIVNDNANMEVKIARGVYDTLGDRLNEVDSQLEQNMTKVNEQFNTIESNIINKMDKNTTNISVTQINKNLGKFDQTYMTDEFLQQITGNTPVNAVPSDKSITNEKLTDDSVYWNNIKDKSFITEDILKGLKVGYKLNTHYTGADEYDKRYCTTGFIEVNYELSLELKNYLRIIFYDKDKNPVSAYRDYVMEYTDVFNLSELLPGEYTKVKFIRCTFYNTSVATFEVKQNDIKLTSQKNEFVLNDFIINEKQIKKSISKLDENTLDIKTIRQVETMSNKINLFDKKNTIKGSWAVNDSGGISFFETLGKSTGFIKCKPNTVYSKTGVPHNGSIETAPSVTLFNKNFEPITVIRTLKSFVTTEDTAYMSCYLSDSVENYREYPLGWNSENFLIVEGLELPDEYVEYVDEIIQLDGLNVNSNNINNNSIGEEKLRNVEISTYFNNGNEIVGKRFIEGGASGNTIVHNDYIVSDFIPIDITKPFNVKNYSRILFYNENKVGLDGLGSFEDINPSAYCEQSNITLHFPNITQAKYIKVCLKKSKLDDNYYIYQDGTNIINDTHRNRKLKIYKENLADEIAYDNGFKNISDTSVVFKKNKDFNSTHFRIPFMCVTNLGTIIAGCDIRYNSAGDHSLIDLGTARSEDGGKTWIDKTVAIPNPGISSTLSRTMDGTILATREGRVFLIGNKFNDGSTGWTNVNTPNDPNWDCVLYHSDDDGRTWEFNQSLKHLLPAGQISFLGGVGSGIQMQDGTLVFPIQMARANDNPFNCQSGIIYSTDNGENWTMGETLVNEYTSECSVVEYPTGTIMINCRQEGQNHRSIYKTTNLGTTWEETPMNSNTQQTNACQGHMCKIKVGFDKEVILFTNPINDGTNREDGAYSGYDRSNLSLSILQNDTKFTPIHTLYRPHSDGYSCMAFDERRNRLYVVMELEYNLVFKDITDLLPTIQMYKNLEDN